MKPLDGLEIYDDAEFYDMEFAGRGHEIPFFLKHAQQAGGPALEVACGTGRITLPIARAGIDIAGLDISRPMLDRARRKAEAEGLTVPWMERDCREIEAEGTYALIFSATNAMQHLHDFASITGFLASAKRALLPGGTLILDVFNPDPAKLARTAATRYLHKTIIDAAGRTLHVEVATQYDAVRQSLDFTLFYLCEDAVIRTKQVSMRCFFPEELLALCRFNGLDVVQRFGNYDETPFGSASPKQILFCRAAPETEL
jgi:ubiquinone/menaquinone biosynthesis C-methylase UbiE